MSPQTLEVLKYLAAASQPTSARKIADGLGLLRPVVHRSLSNLYELGLVERHRLLPNIKKTTYYRVSTYAYARRRLVLRTETDFKQQFGKLLRNPPDGAHD